MGFLRQLLFTSAKVVVSNCGISCDLGVLSNLIGSLSLANEH